MAIPEEWGGVGYDSRTITMVIEEIARVSASLAIMIAVHNSVGLLPVYHYATDEQRKRFLPRLVSKEMSAFSLSEPGAGSDAGALEASRGARRRSLRAERQQELGDERPAGRHLPGVRAHRQDPQGARHLGVHRRARHARPGARQAGRQDGPARLGHRGAHAREPARAGGESPGRGGRGLQDRALARSMPAASESRRRRSA